MRELYFFSAYDFCVFAGENMAEEVWTLRRKAADFNRMAEANGIDPVTARIAVNRGIKETDMAAYFHPALSGLHSPHLMTDLDKGVDLLRAAIEAGTKIRVIGDYDVDGINSTYILYSGIRRAGGDVSWYIPDRVKDGYGLNRNMIRQADADGVGLVITCDNGIAADDATSLAKELGMTVVVTDHHEVPYHLQNAEAGGNPVTQASTVGLAPAGQMEETSAADLKLMDKAEEADTVRVEDLPTADAVIDPHRAGDAYPYKIICGAVVAWKVVIALYEAVGIDPAEANVFLENAAFATNCDVMPLTGENRIILKYGLEALAHTENPGMQALIARKELDVNALSTYTLGFVLGPCFNASGRLASANLAMNLLLAESAEEAALLADQIAALNDERKEMTERGVEEAVAQMADYDLEKSPVIVLFLPDLHESIAGLVAGRIKEKYYHPTFVITRGEDCAKGSGRSVEGYSMYDRMKAAEHLFIKWGGHPMAAGFSLREEDVDEFRRILNETCDLPAEAFRKKVAIDVDMPLSYLVTHTRVIDELALFEPTGTGNDSPLFAQLDVPVLRIRPVGRTKTFYKVTFAAGNRTIDGMYFGEAEDFKACYVQKFGESEWEKALAGKPSALVMKIVYEASWNTFNGVQSPQIIIRSYK